MKFLNLLPLILFSLSAFADEQKCSQSLQNVRLNDFAFYVKTDGTIKVSSKTGLAKTYWTFNASKLGNSRMTATLLLKDSGGKRCKKFDVEIDPNLLCRDSNDQIEPWSYWVYRENEEDPSEYSVVSRKSEITEQAIIRSSRICGYNNVLGNIRIERSNIVSTASSSSNSSKIITGGSVMIQDSDIKGTFTIQNNLASSVDISLTRVKIDGDPIIKSNSRPIQFQDVEIEGNPIITEDSKIMRPYTLDNFSFFMDHVTIDGNPTITAGTEGHNFENLDIIGSPTISGDIIINDSKIEGNGTYSSTAQQDGISKARSLVYGNSVLKGGNQFSGFFNVNKRVADSTVNGAVSRDDNGSIIHTANLSGTLHEFNGSTFTGLGVVSGYAEPGTIINGYVVSTVKHGVLFGASCGAINSSRMSGSVFLDGDTILDNTNATGTFVKENGGILHATSALITKSTISGAPRIISSTIYESSVSGSAYIQNSHLGYSSASCDASVIYEFLEDLSVGCGYPNRLKPSEEIMQEADSIVEAHVQILKLINKKAKNKEEKALSKLRKRLSNF